MAKKSVEDIKRESRHLRGTIAAELAKDSTHFGPDDIQLLKFHGSYQQDDRDLRKDRKGAGQEPAYSMMVRSRIPGGRVTAEQYLVHDRCADEFGNGTIRITSRQGFQLHGVVKGNLKSHLQRINASGLTTWGACGDVVRNCMATPVPLDTPAHRDMQILAQELADAFASKSRAYSEIWLDGEKITEAPEEEPIYGEIYLPRKFKFGIAIPPRNDTDIYTQDVGLAPHCPNGDVEGYTLIIGGGFGMTHGKRETHPVLGQPLGYVKRADLIEVCKAIVNVQRDHGNRENRKRARMKYLIEERGIDWFRGEVKSRIGSIDLEEPKPLAWDTVGDPLGWHEQGDGRLLCCVYVQDGRIRDAEKTRWKTAFREIAERFGFPMRLTPNTNLLFHDIDPAQRAEVNALLKEHGVSLGDDLSEARRTSQACVALPTCGLALAESERVFDEVTAEIEVVLAELGLSQEPLLIRMTGCPNGCARPYNADFALVGRSPEKYALFVGGSHRGDRLAQLAVHTVAREDIAQTVRGFLADFAQNRQGGESFTDFWGRVHPEAGVPDPDQFHLDPSERGVG